VGNHRGGWRLALVCGLVAIAACRPQPGGLPVAYPPGWPLSEVTAPPGSWRAVIETVPVDPSEPLHHGHMIDGVMIGQNRNYVVGFFYNGGWDEAVEHVEKCLEDIPYRVIEDSESKSTSVKEYDVRSRQTVIQLYRQRIKSRDHYHLRAIVY
jgi:hypothetical protein